MMDALAQLNASLTGRYAIDREIGRGGMATVYLARDVRHARNVAVKVLNPELGAVLGVERFLSEIQVTANLQHPNLLPLFDSGQADGLLFYVMPFIEGESLRRRLMREKQLPIDEAIHIGTAAASALDYAHRHGVIHRDLKPENILLHEGQPMVADFGIALAVSVAGGERITQTGISLGTPHYMSPEQATGDRAIDRRTDIYSLGAVLYEMLGGDPPHTASTAQAVIAKVLTDQPRSLRLMRPHVPQHVDAAIERALEKLPADRWNTAHEFAEALQGKAVAVPSGLVTPGSVRREIASASPLRRIVRSPMPWAVAFVLAMTAAVWGWTTTMRAEPQRTVRFMLTFPPNERIYGGVGAGRTVTISPDGRHIAYVSAIGASMRRLVLRSLDDVTPRPLPGTEGATQPFFSPDGKWVGFTANQQLKKVSLESGAVSAIADIGQFFGASWGSKDRIVVPVRNQLVVLSAAGGPTRQTLVERDSITTTLRWVRVLPDGETVLYTGWRGGLTTATIGVASLGTGEMKLLDLTGTSPLGVTDGHLLYGTATGAILAVPFDAHRLRVTGSPALVVDQVAVGGTGAAMADLSANGSLVYQSGSAASHLVLMDPSGASRPLIAEPKPFTHPRFSPDGRSIAVAIGSAGSIDIYIYSIASGTLTRLTTQGNVNDRPEWTPDGKRVLFRTERAGGLALWWQPADFSAAAEPLLELPGRDIWQGVLSPDSRTLVYRHGTIGSGDIFYRRLSGDTAAKPIATTAFTEWAARVSPDGRWVAYGSDESRVMQVYVRPLPGPGSRVQVSVDGGSNPVWSRDGRKLYYANNQQMIAATVTTSPTFAVIERRTLFGSDFNDLPGHANYDVSPDGKHFVMVKPSVSGDQVIVAHNWRAELRAKRHSASPR